MRILSCHSWALRNKSESQKSSLLSYGVAHVCHVLTARIVFIKTFHLTIAVCDLRSSSLAELNVGRNFCVSELWRMALHMTKNWP